ncbi:MAG TPA: ATP-binding protein [Dehalococcoidia bacterium]
MTTTQSPPRDVPFIPAPQSIAETGLEPSLVADLILKAVYLQGRAAGRDIADFLALPFRVIQEGLEFLRREQYCEILPGSGTSEQSYRYTLTSRGADKVAEVMERSAYVGPAPVPLRVYVEAVRYQSVRGAALSPRELEAALGDLVLSRRTLRTLGPAINSGRSVLLFGAPGNGKSTVAERLGRMLPGNVLIPYAVEANGHIIRVFDPRIHVAVESPEEENGDGNGGLTAGVERRRDRRWIKSQRPMVVAGGELTLQNLELLYDQTSKFYVAPLQMKANNGVLLVDDFGRQLIRPKELLNRWIVPLEKGWDYLSFQTGETVSIPFDCLIVFSTNMPPRQLGDEAFLRRIRHKVLIPNPTRSEFEEIFRRTAQRMRVPMEEDALQYLIETYYVAQGREFRGCHARDIIELMLDIARFEGVPPRVDRESIDRACAAYFIEE